MAVLVTLLEKSSNISPNWIQNGIEHKMNKTSLSILITNENEIHIYQFLQMSIYLLGGFFLKCQT